MSAQDVITGSWKTIDDDGVTEKSVVDIFMKDGKVYGKIVQLLDPNEEPDPSCIYCPGERKNQKVIGLEFLRGLKWDGKTWSGGKILDPNNGNEYKCYITLRDDGNLDIRGYIGFALLGRTQTWIKN